MGPHPRLLAEHLNVKEQDAVEVTDRLAGREVSIDTSVTEGSRDEYRDILPAPGPAPDGQVSERYGKAPFPPK